MSRSVSYFSETDLDIRFLKKTSEADVEIRFRRLWNGSRHLFH